MKTFKLKSLTILEEEETKQTQIPLYDGLIINQEGDKKRWIIEAFIHQKYEDFFRQLEKKERIFLEVKITKETNEPAIFLCQLSSINEIEDRINVIFLGQIIDERKNKLEKKLAHLINQGYEGQELLEKFKNSL